MWTKSYVQRAVNVSFIPSEIPFAFSCLSRFAHLAGNGPFQGFRARYRWIVQMNSFGVDKRSFYVFVIALWYQVVRMTRVEVDK